MTCVASQRVPYADVPRSRAKAWLFAAGACAALAVQADYYTGGDNTTDAFTNAALWSGGVAPSDAAGAQIDFLLLGTHYIKTPTTGNDMTFHGKSLTIGEIGGTGAGMVPQSIKGEETITFANDGLFLAKGWMTTWNDGNPYPVIAGPVTVISPNSAPFDVQTGKRNGRFTFTGKVKAASTMALKCSNGTSLSGSSVRFTGDVSEFYGTLLVSGRGFLISNPFPGTLMLEHAVTLGETTTDRMTVTNLYLLSGTTLTVPAEKALGGTRNCAHLRVLGSATAGGPVNVTLSPWNGDWKQGQDGRTEWPFLTVPSASPLTAADFVSTRSEPVFEHTTFHVVEKDNGDGTKTFAMRRRYYVQVEGHTMEFNPDEPDKFGWGSYASSGYDADAVYFSKASDGKYFTFPSRERCELAAYKFLLPANAGKRCQLELRSLLTVIPDLHVQAVDRIFAANVYNGGAEAVLTGKVWMAYGNAGTDVKVEFPVGGSTYRSLHVASTVEGDADAVLDGQSGTPRTLTFSGANSAWTGGMELKSAASGSAAFRGTRPEAFGGPLAAFRADALLFNTNGLLTVTDSMTLATANRGIKIAADSAQVSVADAKTLTVNEKITYDGRLTKIGAGTLELGETPDVTSGTANLVVAAGAVRPTSTNALTGVTVSTANGGVLALDKTLMGASGLIDPKIAEGSRVEVLIENAALGEEVPVFTVGAGTDFSARAVKFSRVNGVRPYLVSRTVGGKTLYSAHVEKRGLAVVVR